MKNWRNMKMKNALPKNAGTTNGKKVLTQPRFLKITKRGTKRTQSGIIIVAKTTAKTTFLPHQLMRENE